MSAARGETETDAGSFALVVDGDGLVIEGRAPGIAKGDRLAPSTWLGAATLDALAAARAGDAGSSVARDYATGAHWVVRARRVGDAPWRARIVGTDATAAVTADRRAVLGSVMHSSRNVSFALLSVLEALDADRPTGADFDPYMVHLREPAARLAAMTSRLGALLDPKPLTHCRITVGSIVEQAAPAARASIAMRPASLADAAIHGDFDALVDAVGALLETSAEAPTLTVEPIDVGGRAHVRFAVERAASTSELSSPLAQWDLGDGHRLESRVRLAVARVAVLAHDGTLLAEAAPAGRLRLAVALPISAD